MTPTTMTPTEQIIEIQSTLQNAKRQIEELYESAGGFFDDAGLLEDNVDQAIHLAKLIDRDFEGLLES